MRIAHGVVEQDRQQLAQPLRIAQQRQRLGGRLGLHQDAALVRQCARLLERLVERAREIDRLALQRERVDVAARHRQQVVDDERQLARGVDDAVKRALVFVDRLVAPAQRHLGLAADRGGRRAQLVADVGEELAPARIDLLQRAQGVLQLAVRACTSSSRRDAPAIHGRDARRVLRPSC
jgi:hypothetical protein